MLTSETSDPVTLLERNPSRKVINRKTCLTCLKRCNVNVLNQVIVVILQMQSGESAQALAANILHPLVAPLLHRRWEVAKLAAGVFTVLKSKLQPRLPQIIAGGFVAGVKFTMFFEPNRRYVGLGSSVPRHGIPHPRAACAPRRTVESVGRSAPLCRRRVPDV